MEIVTSSALTRGAALVDFAFSQDGRASDMSVADAVGIVAAYIAKRRAPFDLQEDLGARLTPEIGRQAARAYDLFNDRRSRGLWTHCTVTDATFFTHPLLDEAYPHVNVEHSLLAEWRAQFG